VTGCLRTGDSKKFESIRINLRDLAWSQVFPRDPGFLQSWIPGTRPGTTPGIPSKLVVVYELSSVFFSGRKKKTKRDAPKTSRHWFMIAFTYLG
jgi:hypothetical protein